VPERREPIFPSSATLPLFDVAPQAMSALDHGRVETSRDDRL
jgi:hypothetical protein